MHEVYQRVEGWPFGECVRATYASIFELPIDAVPRFDPASLGPGDDQRERERAWLRTLGIRLVEIRTDADRQLPAELLRAVPPVIHLISGVSPRGFGHRCVGYAGRVLHDPHPSGAGLVTVYSIGLLLPMDHAE